MPRFDSQIKIFCCLDNPHSYKIPTNSWNNAMSGVVLCEAERGERRARTHDDLDGQGHQNQRQEPAMSYHRLLP